MMKLFSKFYYLFTFLSFLLIFSCGEEAFDDEVIEKEENVVKYVIDRPSENGLGVSITSDTVNALNSVGSFTNEFYNTYLWNNSLSQFDTAYTLIKFTAMNGLTVSSVDSAFLTIYADVFGTGRDGLTSNNGLRIYRVLEEWSFTTVNWINKPEFDRSFFVESEAVFMANTLRINITSLINLQIQSANYGFCLLQTNANASMSIASFRNASKENRPFLEFFYTDNE